MGTAGTAGTACIISDIAGSSGGDCSGIAAFGVLRGAIAGLGSGARPSVDRNAARRAVRVCGRRAGFSTNADCTRLRTGGGMAVG